MPQRPANVTAALAQTARADASGGRLGTPAERAAARRLLALREANKTRLDVFLKAHRGALENEARKMLACHAQSEDAVQEAALRAMSTANQFNPGRADNPERGFRAWFYTILTNVCIDMKRHGGKSSYTVPFSDLPEVVIEEATIDPGPDPLAILLAKEGVDGYEGEMRTAFISLSGNHQAILQACIIDEMEEVEVAELWHFSPGAIRSKLSEARAALLARVNVIAIQLLVAFLETLPE